MKRVAVALVLLWVAAGVLAQVGPLCVPCQTCNDVLSGGVKINMVAGVYDYEWTLPCGTVYGTLTADRKKIMLDVPSCCSIRVCRKAGTECETSGWLPCGQGGTFGISNGKELSHVSILAASCNCATPTPTRTPTPPGPTATPTPPPPTPTATPTNPPSTPTPTPTVCVPETECYNRCGTISDGCSGTLDCGICPPPPPPPGKTPSPVCDECVWAQYASLIVSHGPEEGQQTVEYMTFQDAAIIRQLVLDPEEDAEFTVYLGPEYGVIPTATMVFKVKTGEVVTIPFPGAGVPVQQFKSLWFTGGDGRLTVFLDSKYSIWIKGIRTTS